MRTGGPALPGGSCSNVISRKGISQADEHEESELFLYLRQYRIHRLPNQATGSWTTNPDPDARIANIEGTMGSGAAPFVS